MVGFVQTAHRSACYVFHAYQESTIPVLQILAVHTAGIGRLQSAWHMIAFARGLLSRQICVSAAPRMVTAGSEAVE